jgi:predicted TPR repeat methyltransferase
VSYPTADDSAQAQARQHFLRGLANFGEGLFHEALTAFEAALALAPRRASVLINLAATLLQLGRPHDALAHADTVLQTDPNAIEAWLHRGHALAQLGQLEGALQAMSRVHEIDPAHAVAWTSRGHVLREMGAHLLAREAYQHALTLGASPGELRYYLAAMGGIGPHAAPMNSNTVDAPPEGYVASLFNGYADDFEHHLTQDLGYDAHHKVWQLVQPTHLPMEGFAATLDLGCGTGLCGRLARARTQRLVGVDLAAKMVERARDLGVYDEVHLSDLVDFLRHGDERFDLVLCADVFIYVGALEATFDALKPRLKPAALLAFSVECPDDLLVGWRLLPSLRFAHSEDYLCALATRHGLHVLDVQRAAVRKDQGQAVLGLFVLMRLAG